MSQQSALGCFLTNPLYTERAGAYGLLPHIIPVCWEDGRFKALQHWLNFSELEVAAWWGRRGSDVNCECRVDHLRYMWENT